MAEEIPPIQILVLDGGCIASLRLVAPPPPPPEEVAPPPPPPPTPPPPTELKCEEIPLPGIPVIDQIIIALCWIFAPLFNTVNSAIHSASTALAPYLNPIAEAIRGIKLEAPEISWPDFQEIFRPLTEAVAALKIADLLTALNPLTRIQAIADWLTSLNKVPEQAQTWFADQTLKGMTTGTPDWVENFINQFGIAATDAIAGNVDLATKVIEPVEAYDPLTAYKTAKSFYEHVSAAVASVGSVGAGTEVASVGQVETVFQALAGILVYTGYPQVASKIHGLPGEIGLLKAYELYLQRYYRSTRLADAEVDKALLRGEYKEDEWREYYRYSGLTEGDIDARHKLLTLIPGPADLIRFLVKEVITPEQFGERMAWLGYGYGETETGEITYFTEEGKKTFTVPRTVYEFWTAHWIPPDRGELYDMRRRGLIDDAELLRWLAIIDVDPRMIDNIAALRFRLPGRIESRLMYETVGATDKELTEWLQADGLRPDLIPAMLKYLKSFPARGEKRRYITVLRKAYGKGKISADELKTEIQKAGYPVETADWIVLTEEARLKYGLLEEEVREEPEYTKGEASAFYRAGLISDDEYKAILAEKGYDSETQELFLKYTQTRLPSEPPPPDKAITKSEVQASYIAGLIDENQARSMMLEMGYDKREQDFLIRYWNSRIPKEKPPPDPALTKSELMQLWQLGLISIEDFETELKTRLYDPSEISRIKSLSAASQVSDERSALRSAALADFIDGFIDESTLRANLAAVAYQPAEIELFIASAIMKRNRDRARDLLAVYRDAFYKDLISEDEYRVNLAALRLLPERIEDIIAREQIRKIPKPKPEKLPPARDLTLAQLFSAWKVGLLTDDQLGNELVVRGYSASEATLLIETEKAKMAS